MGQTMTSVQKWIRLFIVLAQLVMNCKMWEDTIYMECHYLNEQRVSSSTRHDIHSSPTSDYHTTKDAVNYMDSSTKRNNGSLPLHSNFFLLLLQTTLLISSEKAPNFFITITSMWILTSVKEVLCVARFKKRDGKSVFDLPWHQRRENKMRQKK